MKHLLIFLCTIFTFSISGQNLVLQSTSSKKVFKPGKFLSIMVDMKEDDNCQCETIQYDGEFLGVTDGNIRMKVHFENYTKVADEESIIKTTDSKGEKIQEKLINQKNVIGVSKTFSPKKRKSKNVIGGIGGMLIIGGLVSTANGLSLGDDKSKGNMAILGISQIVVGTTLAIIGYSKKKYLIKSEAYPKGEYSFILND